MGSSRTWTPKHAVVKLSSIEIDAVLRVLESEAATAVLNDRPDLQTALVRARRVLQRAAAAFQPPTG